MNKPDISVGTRQVVRQLASNSKGVSLQDRSYAEVVGNSSYKYAVLCSFKLLNYVTEDSSDEEYCDISDIMQLDGKILLQFYVILL